MKATFENSVDVLVKAYLNDTLLHGWCSACAVGNLVAAANSTLPEKNPEILCYDTYVSGLIPRWDNVFMSTGQNVRQLISPDRYFGEARRQIDSTGYTWQQLAQIERAFETAPMGTKKRAKDYWRDDQWMFNGLLAVVDVLAEIHNVDLTAKESAIGQFQKVKSEKVTA